MANRRNISNLYGLLGIPKKTRVIRETVQENKPTLNPPLNPPVPPGRVSQRTGPQFYSDTTSGVKFLAQSELLRFVPLVRRLSILDRNVGLVVHDLILLANTGIKIKFDPSVDADKAEEYRKEINEASKEWLEGGAGIHSIINKMIGQIIIGGAISAEWVPNKNLDGIDYTTFVNPEDIIFGLNPTTGRYEPYQEVKSWFSIDNPMRLDSKIKLNPFTYKYFSYLGDTDMPYGVPVLITALKDINVQENMLKNINFITEQLGLMGFIQLLIQKPSQNKDESNKAYEARLNRLLTDSKKNILAGSSDGVVVGFDEDHKYEFNSTTKDVRALPEVFKLNQQLVANGLKYPQHFLGSGEGTDTAMSIIFTKVLSQLNNIQTLVASSLQYGLSLHLRLRKKNFESLTVEFKPSTITDDLKTQQAREIRQRVNRLLHDDGIIDQDIYADDMGYTTPSLPEARISHDPIEIADEAKKRQEREKDKDTSDRKGREKKKPQPKRKDQKSE